jgi:hypothetical protein
MENALTQGQSLYFKLHRCLEKAMSDKENLGCHVNDIVLYLARSIKSGETWYDSFADVWCDYFLRNNS